MKVLVLNIGSSSIKAALYHVAKSMLACPHPPLWSGEIEWKGIKKASKAKKLLKKLIDEFAHEHNIDAVGHRVVHGGPTLKRPVVVTKAVKAAIRKAIPLAPLHNPLNLLGIETIEVLLPGIPQVAAFDTAYGATLSEAASTYAGPYQWNKIGIKRYGFHGINHYYCAHRCAFLLKRPLADLHIITCHLGNGSSLAATAKGICVDTTMGFTPLDGLMMGTRPGALDPGIFPYLLRQKKLSLKQLDHQLNKECGLLGISGKSSDMRDILRLKRKDGRCQLAFDMYLHSLKRHVGAMAAVLGRVDALVFTAGIGENAAEVRLAGAAALGCLLDGKANKSATLDRTISISHSPIAALIIKAEEDWAISIAVTSALAM